MIKVSVVIPVYNGETYLRQCLDSVCAQTLEEIEIICVDDGSMDSSRAILEEYREKDPRFRLIYHSENQGLPGARNSGQAEAQGEYLIFWDCDDFFEPKALELLYQRATETDADICVCGADRYFDDKGKQFPHAYLDLKRVPKNMETFNRFTNPEHILDFTCEAVWNKLYRRAFLEEHEITTPPFPFGEDVYHTSVALCLAERIATVKNVLVHYRVNNPNSLMGKSTQDTRVYFQPRIAVAEYLRQKGILPAQSFGRKVAETIMFVLRWGTTKESFKDTVDYLREEGVLETLCIVERGPEYYNSFRQSEYIKHLLHDETDDLLMFVLHDTYTDLRGAAAERNRAWAERDKLKKRLAKDKETYEAELSRLQQENDQSEKERETLSTQLEEANAQLAEVKAQLEKEREALSAKLEKAKMQLREEKSS